MFVNLVHSIFALRKAKVCRNMYATISFKSVVCFLKIKSNITQRVGPGFKLETSKRGGRVIRTLITWFWQVARYSIVIGGTKVVFFLLYTIRFLKFIPYIWFLYFDRWFLLMLQKWLKISYQLFSTFYQQPFSEIWKSENH